MFVRQSCRKGHSRRLSIERLESRQLLAVDYVVHISVDGIGGPYLPALIEAEAASGEGDYPNYLRLVAEGSLTFNARTDFSNTSTLPNHVTMLTGRPVLTPEGAADDVAHGWSGNSDPPIGATLHNNNPSIDYVSSVFDVVHDEGLSTALYASKSKFSLFVTSYNEHGAPDTNPTGGDNGTVKIDTAMVGDIDAIFETMLVQLEGDTPANYTFFHSLIPDTIGHRNGWGSDIWNDWLIRTDQDLGRIMNAIESSPILNGRTAIVLTTDHGGVGFSHADPAKPENYTIPFFVWGPEVDASQDLYAAYAETVTDPGTGRPDYAADAQPIRNGDSANLALTLLGLPNIPGSTLDLLTTCEGDDCNTEIPDPDPDPPDTTGGPPQVVDFVLNGDGRTPNRLDSIEFAFDQDVLDSVTADDLSIRNSNTGQNILLPQSAKVPGHAEWRIGNLGLEPGFYHVTLQGTGIFDSDGVNLDGNGDGMGGDSWQDTVIIAAPGDANVDGVVDTRDYQIVQQQQASTGAWRDGDFDANGTVDNLDLEIWMSARFSDLRPTRTASTRIPQSAATLQSVPQIAPDRLLVSNRKTIHTVQATRLAIHPWPQTSDSVPPNAYRHREFARYRFLDRRYVEPMTAITIDRVFADLASVMVDYDDLLAGSTYGL